MQPKVSIIIPTYKRVDTLSRAINSALAQTYPNIEIIVVDDNNPDTEFRRNAESLMSKYSDNAKIKYERHPCNKNGSAARNTGVRVCTGEYVAFLDDDDEYLPHKIENMINCLLSMPSEFALCYSKVVLQKGEGKPFVSKETREGSLFFEALSRQFCICAGSNLLIRKDAFDSVGGFDERFIRNQDVELLTKLLEKYKIAFSKEEGVLVHLHNNHNYFNPITIIDQYVDCFSQRINSLDELDRKRIYKVINEEKFFVYLRSNHDLKCAIKMITCGDINIFRALNVINNHLMGLIHRQFTI